MRGHRVTNRVDLVDDEGSCFSVIVATDGPTWKLYATFQKLGEPEQTSTVWQFIDEERAVAHGKEKVTDAVLAGWRVMRVPQ